MLASNTLLGSTDLEMGQLGYGIVHQDCQRDLRHLLILSLEWGDISSATRRILVERDEN